MSSMIKKKAAFGKTFKPKAPQLRKPPGAPLSATSSARPSIESHSQSQTPTPATLPDVRTSTQPDTHDIITGSQSQPVEVEPTPQPKSTTSEAALSQTAAATENRKRRAEVEQPNASSEPTLQPPTKKTRIIPSTQDSGEQSQDVVQQTMAIQQSQSRNGQASTIKSAEAQSLGPQSPSFASLVPSSTPNTSTKQYRVDTLVTFPVLTGDAHQSDTPILDPTPQTSNSQSSSRETTQETRSEGEVDLSAVGPGQSNGRSQIIPSVPLVLDGTSGVANIDESNVEPESESQPQQGSALRRKKIRPQEGDARTPIDMQTHRPKRATGEKKSRKKKEGERKKRRRAETPEGAEDAPLPAGITMGDLCKDLRIGKKWSKADEIKRKDNERKIKAKLDRENDILNDTPLALAERAADAGESPANGNGAGVIASSGEGATNDDENAANRHQGGSAEGDGARGEGVQMTIINGNIVIDERSREWDAHKAANEGRVHEVVEENDFSKLITAGSHMKKVRAMQWTAADTELFYKCLKTYGTDFGMIAKVFPGRNRRQIKLKFNAEDRHFPAKITKVLTGTPEPIDVNEHQKQAGVQFEDLEAIEAAQKAEDDRHAEEEAERAEAAAELTRKKKAEIQSLAGRGAEQPEGTDGEASAAPKSKKKGAARNKAKNKHSIGGEEVEIVGTIDR